MRIAFLGTPAFAVPSLEALHQAGHALVAVVAQPDRPAGRGQALRAPATKVWAEAHGVPVLQPQKVRDGVLAGQLAALGPDALVVAAYGRILGTDLLHLAPYGAINVHGSLLPRWRGAAPIQWSVASGDHETGVTIMQMDEGLDTGDILLQRAMEIRPDDTAETLSERMAGLGGAALVEALQLLERAQLVPVKQDPALATAARILEKEDGRIDWARPAGEIAARLRGFTPWPGAFTTLGGKMVKVVEASPLTSTARASTGSARAETPRSTGSARAEAPDSTGSAPMEDPLALTLRQAQGKGEAGHALRVPGRGLAVACGASTALLVTRLQPEGKPAQDALAFLNGLRKDEVTFGT